MDTERHLIKVAAQLLLKKDNKILLLLRQNTGHRDGEYGLVAGHVEAGERVKDCIIREAAEEAGIVLLPQDVRCVHTFYRTFREYVNFFFVAEKWQGEIQNMEPEKCAELTWFDIDNLPDNFIPYLKDVVELYKKGEFFSEDDKDT